MIIFKLVSFTLLALLVGVLQASPAIPLVKKTMTTSKAQQRSQENDNTGAGGASYNNNNNNAASSGRGGYSGAARGLDSDGFTEFHGNEETRLIEYLTNNYRGYGLARPVRDVTQPMDIYFRLIVEEFSGLDEQLGVVRIIGTVTAMWRDEFLRWNSSLFSGIDALVLRDQQVFMPIIIPVGHGSHKAPIFHQSASAATAAIVWTDNKGLVHASITETFETSCKIDLTDFPVDTQHCQFIFKALRFRRAHLKLRLFQNVQQLNNNNNVPIELQQANKMAMNESQQDEMLISGDGDGGDEEDNDDGGDDEIALSESANNQMWNVIGLQGDETIVNTSSGLSFSAVVYTISVQRKADYYLWNILLPSASMAAVQTSVFFLPFSTERVMFSITAVLAVDIFQSSLNERIHTSSEPVPLIKYSTAQLMMGIVITIESIIVLGLVRSTRPLPRWLANFIDKVIMPKRRRNDSIFNDLTGQEDEPPPEQKITINNHHDRHDTDESSFSEAAVAATSSSSPCISCCGCTKKLRKNHRDLSNALIQQNHHHQPRQQQQQQQRGPSIFIDIAGERRRLSIFIDRAFLVLIVLFFSVLPIIFFKFAA